MRTAGLVVAALLLLILAGAVLTRDQGRRTPPASSEPHATSTPSGTHSPAARETVVPLGDHASPAEVAASAYALAATNWSATTYAAGVRRRARLADGRLSRQLLDGGVIARVMPQLRADRASRLGAVLDVRAAEVQAARASVLVDVDELQIVAGRRTRQTIRYRVHLHRRATAWRITAFGAVASKVGP